MQGGKPSIGQNVLVRSIRVPFCPHSFSSVTRIINPEWNYNRIPDGKKGMYKIKIVMCSVGHEIMISNVCSFPLTASTFRNS